ncbi:MAG: roadblock/LC7 domain-containing protein [Candidatus Njordarchaeales archaeon]
MPLPMLGRKTVESVRNQLISILKEVESKDPEIEGSVLIRADGLVLASALPADIDRDLVAAMSASALNVSTRVLEELRRGTLENVIIRGAMGVVMIISVAQDIVLAAIGKKDANLGLMLVEMRRAAEKLKNVIEKI